jgi:hypothetical protein
VCWLDQDCAVIRFSAPDFASQQVRRMAGVLLAVVRGTEPFSYLDRVADGSVRTSTPLVPAEATWLDAVYFKDDAAEALRHPEPPKPGRALLLGAARASAQAYRDLASEMDAGLATRRAEVEALRAAAAAGDVDALEAVLRALNIPSDTRESNPHPVVTPLSHSHPALTSYSCSQPVDTADSPIITHPAMAGKGSTHTPADARERAGRPTSASRAHSPDSALPRFVPALGAQEPCVSSLLDSRDGYGRTALFLAAGSGCAPAVEALLRRGASAAAAAHGGCTPGDAAHAAGFDAVARLLAEAEQTQGEQPTTSAVGERGLEALPPWRRPGGAEARGAASPHGGRVYHGEGSGHQPTGTAHGAQTAPASESAHQIGEITLLIGDSEPAIESAEPDLHSISPSGSDLTPSEAVHAGELPHDPLPQNATTSLAPHPGAGSVLIEEALAPQDVSALLALHATLPVAPKDKPSPIDRAYFADAEGWLSSMVARAVEGAIPLLASGGATAHATETQPCQEDAPGLPCGVTGTTAAGVREDEGAPPLLAPGDAEARLPEKQPTSVNTPGPEKGSTSKGNAPEPESTPDGRAGWELGKGGPARQKGPMPACHCTVAPLVRFLHYTSAGGSLPAHVDLCRVLDGGARTSHTFLLYLNDCERGGETLLLGAREGDEALAPAGGVAPGERAVVASVRPKRGRLLVTPHACPHMAAATTSQKLVLRGELLLHPPSGAAA